MDKYIISKKEDLSYELIIKKSKFIAKVFYVEDTITANEYIEKCRKEYNDARHVVYAYRLINTGKFSDDKEPQNTAGKPIYNLLEKENLVNVLVVVIRYFGGILLGTGPLARAYTTATKECLKEAGKEKYVEYVEKNIICDYNMEEIVKRNIILNNGKIKEITRNSKVNIKYLEKK